MEASVSQLEEVGDRDGWRCWLCDQTVDPDMPPTDPRGASVDARTTKAKAKKQKGRGTSTPERLAHKGCNTGKGAVDPVVPWPEELFVVDPAPIIAATDRLARKGGREAMARCPTAEDAEATATWLGDRLSRLHPELDITTRIEEGGGQYVVSVQV